MLTNASISVRDADAGVVVITAGILGIEAEVDYRENGRTIIDLSGKTEKVRRITRNNRVTLLSEIESIPGEYEGFGLLTDIADGRQVNYGALMSSRL